MIASTRCRQKKVLKHRVLTLCLTVAAVLPALVRNLLAHGRPSEAAAGQLFCYAALLLVSPVAAQAAGLGAEALGLGRARVRRRLAGALLLATVLVVPGLIHGVSVPRVIAALPGAFAVAAIEELLFRGVLFALWQQRAGAASAVITTSLAFAATHLFLYPPPILLLGFVVGLLLGSWRAIADDLGAPILAHTMADAVAAGTLAAPW